MNDEGVMSVFMQGWMKNTEKKQKFQYLDGSEQREFHRTLLWIAPSEPKFYGEYYSSK